MKCLVTGGTGFVGSNLIKLLLNLSHEVIATGLSSENLINVPILSYELNDIKNLNNVDVVFHQSANNNTLDFNKESMYDANVNQPKKLFERLLDIGCKHFIYASSTAVYGNSQAPYDENTTINPLNPYGESKAMFDEFAMDFGKKNKANVIGLRYCNIFGPGEQHKGKRSSMIYQLFCQMSSNKQPEIFYDGFQKRDWCYVENIVEANIASMNFFGCEIFNIGSGKSVTFNYLIDILNKQLNKNLKPIYIKNPYEDTFQNYTECNIKKAAQLLNWQPKYNVDEGISYLIKL